jgi:predicted DNA binding protein
MRGAPRLTGYALYRHVAGQRFKGGELLGGMEPVQVTLRVRTRGDFSEITRRFRSASICLWCNRESDVSEVAVDDPSEAGPVAEALREAGEEFVEASKGRLLIVDTRCTCTRENSVHPHMDDLNLIRLSPIVYHAGEETHQLVALRHGDLEELLARIEGLGFTYQVLYKAPLRGGLGGFLSLPLDSLAGGLTGRQLEALLAAYREGYYEYPRRMDVQGIAARRGVPRSTYREHLSRAENKLIRGIAPYLELNRLARRRRP